MALVLRNKYNAMSGEVGEVGEVHPGEALRGEQPPTYFAVKKVLLAVRMFDILVCNIC